MGRWALLLGLNGVVSAGRRWLVVGEGRGNGIGELPGSGTVGYGAI